LHWINPHVATTVTVHRMMKTVGPAAYTWSGPWTKFMLAADCDAWLKQLQQTPGPFEVKFRKQNGATRTMQCNPLGSPPTKQQRWSANRMTPTTWTLVDSDADDWRTIRTDSIYTIRRIPPDAV
jgi:hypothetical protein